MGTAGFSVMYRCSSTATVDKWAFGCMALSRTVGPQREEGNSGWIVVQTGCCSNNSTNIEIIQSISDKMGGS